MTAARCLRGPRDWKPDRKLADNGIYFVGDRGTMLCGGWSGPPRLVPGEQDEGSRAARRRPFPARSAIGPSGFRPASRRSPRTPRPASTTPGPFTEALLVGNLAVRLQKRIEWDSAAMKATNAPEADALIRKTYRSGFGI